jgi:hypothetical protein
MSRVPIISLRRLPTEPNSISLLLSIQYVCTLYILTIYAGVQSHAYLENQLKSIIQLFTMNLGA